MKQVGLSESSQTTGQAPSRRSGNLRLPQLLDQRALSEELNVTSAAAEKIMRQVPKVHFPGLRKVYVKRDDVIRVIEEATRL
jgi:hypothetical protein